MSVNHKIFTILILSILFTSCGRNKNMQFSFEKIQDCYYENLTEPTCVNPFYFPVFIFPKIEQELNESIKDSNYCSVRIVSSINSGILTVSALYNNGNKIYLKEWNYGDDSTKTKVQDPQAKRILKSKPRTSMIINEDLVLDGTSVYVIKKIKNETYYYLNHHDFIDEDYEPLIKLFQKFDQTKS